MEANDLSVNGMRADLDLRALCKLLLVCKYKKTNHLCLQLLRATASVV
jgi:hypothetical protein